MASELLIAKRLLDQAKREPAHSPTEDALIDAIEKIIEHLENVVIPVPRGY